MGLNKELKQIIVNSDMTIYELKKKLLVKDSNELLNILTKAIISEVSYIDSASCSTSHEWLIHPLKYIVEIISNDEEVQTPENLYNMNLIKDSLVPKKNLSKDINHLYSMMLDIINPIIKILSKRNKKSQKINETDANLYKFAGKLIFGINNYDYLFQITRTYPELINSVDSENIPIIYYIIKRQIKNIKSGAKIHKKLYFDRVMNIIMECNDFYLTDKQLHIILDYLKSELKQVQESQEENEELLLFIKDTMNKLKVKSKMTTTPQNVRDLFKKYNIHELDSDYLCEDYLNIKTGELKDYTDKNVITIDISDKVRLFDDAISMEILPNGNYLIGVYIADVASLIPYESKLDIISYNRAETIYLEDRVIDMLPLDLAYTCSLNTESDKKVIAYMFEFNKYIELEKFRVERAMIRVRKNLTFDTSQKLYLSNFKPENTVGEMLKNLIHFHEKFEASNFYNHNYHIFKDEVKRLENIKSHHNNNNLFNNLVASFMILVNRSMAKFFYENGYPFLYRINNSNIDEETINEIKNSIVDKQLPNNLIKKIDKIYSRSKYSSVNTGHNGLNLEHYCHTTNPIRSYASLLTQRLISYEFLNGGVPDKILYEYEEKLPVIASYLNSKIDIDNNFTDEYSKIHKRNHR